MLVQKLTLKADYKVTSSLNSLPSPILLTGHGKSAIFFNFSSGAEAARDDAEMYHKSECRDSMIHLIMNT